LLAPEHEVENARRKRKAEAKGKKLRLRQPPEGFRGWNEETLRSLGTRPASHLLSRVELSARLLLEFLGRPGDGREQLEAFLRAAKLAGKLETALLARLDAMVAALQAEDPGSRAVPYCLSGGTDSKSFSLLGIRGFGFAPLRLPADLDFTGMFHGVDERVPTDSLRFGTRVLDRFLSTC
jgi:hypothetical protein